MPDIPGVPRGRFDVGRIRREEAVETDAPVVSEPGPLGTARSGALVLGLLSRVQNLEGINRANRVAALARVEFIEAGAIQTAEAFATTEEGFKNQVAFLNEKIADALEQTILLEARIEAARIIITQAGGALAIFRNWNPGFLDNDPAAVGFRNAVTILKQTF